MLQEFGSAKNQNIPIYENRRFQNVPLFNTGVGPQQFVTETNFLENRWLHSHFVICSSNTYVKFLTFLCLIKTVDLNMTG